MRYLGLIVFLAFGNLSYGFNQETDRSRFNLCVSSGIIKNTFQDQLVNYYNYSGLTWRNLKLDGSADVGENLFLAGLSFTNSKLNPEQLNKAYYDYNYMNQWSGDCSLSYYRTIWKVNKHLKIGLGASYQAYFIILKEYFKNTLYDYANSFRKSYDVSVLDLAPSLSVNYKVTRHQFTISTGYTVLNAGARPDDDYVKQIGQKNSMDWRFYSLHQYIHIRTSASYQYQLRNSTGIRLEYKLQYQSCQNPAVFKYLQECVFVGISKTF